jgi:hypothetical protein
LRIFAGHHIEQSRSERVLFSTKRAIHGRKSERKKTAPKTEAVSKSWIRDFRGPVLAAT